MSKSIIIDFIEQHLEKVYDTKDKSQNISELRLKGSYFFEEGWVTRLFLHWYSNNHQDFHSNILPKNTNWYSEACIESPFRLKKAEKLLEYRNVGTNDGTTYADSVIGDFQRVINNTTKSKIKLLPGAKEFFIIEAKINSGLSSGVSNANKNYSQAARNVACLIHMMQNAEIDLQDNFNIGFYVITPKNNKFYQNIKTDVYSKIDQQINNRYENLYKQINDNDAKNRFNKFLNYKNKALKKLKIEIITWEDIISQINGEFREEFTKFYNQTLLECGVIDKR